MKVCAIHYMFADYDECPHCVIEERDRLREELKAREDEHKAAYYQSYENFWTILNLREERDRQREQVALLLELDESGGKREYELRKERDRYRNALEDIAVNKSETESPVRIARRALEGK